MHIAAATNRRINTHELRCEVLVYYDEAVYFEHKGKESGIVRFTFEMIEGLKIVEEEEAADYQE